MQQETTMHSLHGCENNCLSNVQLSILARHVDEVWIGEYDFHLLDNMSISGQRLHRHKGRFEFMIFDSMFQTTLIVRGSMCE